MLLGDMLPEETITALPPGIDCGRSPFGRRGGPPRGFPRKPRRKALNYTMFV